MGLIKRLQSILKPLVGVPPLRVPHEGLLTEARAATQDDELGWRRLSGDSKRDLSPMSRERMQDAAAHLWRTSPLANRLIELPLSYLLGGGVRLLVADEEAQGWLDQFWRDPINGMDMKLVNKARELALFGEQFWPVFVNEGNGHMRLGTLDPSLIDEVVFDPDNSEQPIGVLTKRDVGNIRSEYRVIINGPEDVLGTRAQMRREHYRDGECFYFAINRLAAGGRGYSDLLSQIDWLDAYDQALYGEVERWNFLRAFVWDITIKGRDQDYVDKRAREITAPEPGSVRVHNDSEEWRPLSPALGSAESSENARLFRNNILSAATLPEHWFGGGGDVNRATAGEMGEPTFKVISMRQRQLGHILSEVGTYVIRQKLRILYGSDIEGVADPSIYKIKVEWPELTARDTSKYATALQQVVVAVGVASDRGLLGMETAVKLIGEMAERIGVTIDPAAELETAKAEAALKAEADSFDGE